MVFESCFGEDLPHFTSPHCRVSTSGRRLHLYEESEVNHMQITALSFTNRNRTRDLAWKTICSIIGAKQGHAISQLLHPNHGQYQPRHESADKMFAITCIEINGKGIFAHNSHPTPSNVHSPQTHPILTSTSQQQAHSYTSHHTSSQPIPAPRLLSPQPQTHPPSTIP